MKESNADRQARLEALRDFSADQRMRNHEKPLSASKETNTQDCSCSDADRRMTNHTRPLKFSKETPTE